MLWLIWPVLIILIAALPGVILYYSLRDQAAAEVGDHTPEPQRNLA